MKAVIVTKELASVGMSVMRGRDWEYSPQDGIPGSKGIVTGLEDSLGINWVSVQWGNGTKYAYRVGASNKFDLYVYVPGYYDKPVAKGKERLTLANAKVGLKVELRLDATTFAKEKLRSIPNLEIRLVDAYGVSFQDVSSNFKPESFDICNGQTVITGTGGEFAKEHSKPFGEVIYKFRKGDVVYLRTSDSWSTYSGVKSNIPYVILEVRTTNMRLDGVTHWQRQDQFMEHEEWVRGVYTQTKLPEVQTVAMKDIQKNIVAISENSKPNIKHGTDRNNTDPIKVRRTISTIQGPKRRG